MSRLLCSVRLGLMTAAVAECAMKLDTSTADHAGNAKTKQQTVEL